MTETAQAPPAGKKAAKEAEYVVLRLVKPEASIASTPAPETWEKVGSFFKAATSEQALRQASKQGDGYDEKGTYVAVRARSWRPLKPKVTTVTRVTFS